jgi:hypothetical protein
MKYIEFKYPDDFYGYRNLKGKEIKKFFEWYVEQSNIRINELERYYLSSSKNNRLDFTPESLIGLWEWFRKKIEIVPRPVEEVELHRKMVSELFVEYVPTEELSKRTKSLIIDISYYFAQIIILNNPKITWGYFTKPKSRVSLNSPVLLGFKYKKDLDPRLIVKNCAYATIENENIRELYDVYNVWLKYIE